MLHTGGGYDGLECCILHTGGGYDGLECCILGVVMMDWSAAYWGWL